MRVEVLGEDCLITNLSLSLSKMYEPVGYQQYST